MTNGIKNKERIHTDKEIEKLFSEALPLNYLKRFNETTFIDESIEIKAYIIYFFNLLLLYDYDFKPSEITTFKKMAKTLIDFNNKELKQSNIVLSEREKLLNDLFKEILDKNEKDLIEKEINELDFNALKDLVNIDTEYLNELNGKNYNQLQPNEVFKYSYASYRFLTIRADIERNEIKELTNFKYANDTNRKKADSLLNDGVNFILKYLNGDTESEKEKSEISENDYKLSKWAKDTKLTRFNYSNLGIREATLSWYNFKQLSYKEQDKHNSLIKRLSEIDRDIEALDGNNEIVLSELLKEKEKVIKEIKEENIIKVNTTDKGEIDYKPVNANSKKVLFTEIPKKNLVITEYLDKKIFITQHKNDLLDFNEYVSTLLDNIYTKVFRERKTEITFNKSELKAIFTNTHEQNLIGAVLRAVGVISDMTINAFYKDYSQSNKPDIALKGVKIIDNYNYSKSTNLLTLTITLSVAKWVLSSFYKYENKELEHINPKYNLVMGIISDGLNKKEEREKVYLLTDIAESLGQPTTEHISMTNRDYLNSIVNPTYKDLNKIKEMATNLEIKMPNRKPSTRKQVEKAKITIKNKKK